MYTKKEWINNETIIMAEDMNRIETAIEGLVEGNIIKLPSSVIHLKQNSTSQDIAAIFGNRYMFDNMCSQILAGTELHIFEVTEGRSFSMPVVHSVHTGDNGCYVISIMAQASGNTFMVEITRNGSTFVCTNSMVIAPYSDISQIQDLQTQSKTIVGAINELKNSSGSGSGGLNNLMDVGTGSLRGLRCTANTVLGDYSTALGMDCKTGDSGAFAVGSGAYAQGEASLACGKYTTASGSGSFAAGSSTKATGYECFAIGGYSEAKGNQSFAAGTYTVAEGHYSFVAGKYSKALGEGSVAFGNSTTADQENQFVCGIYNEAAPNGLFVVGNGGRDKSTAFAVNTDGSIYCKNLNTADKDIVAAVNGLVTQYNLLIENIDTVVAERVALALAEK